MVVSPLQALPSDYVTPALVVLTLIIVALTYLLLREQRKTNRLKTRQMGMQAREGGAATNPTCKCAFEHLPPYTEAHSLTKLTIHNGGNCSLSQPRTTVKLSWAPLVTIGLDWFPDTDFVANEDKIFEFGLPEPPRGDHTIRVKTDGIHPITRDEIYFTYEEKISN